MNLMFLIEKVFFNIDMEQIVQRVVWAIHHEVLNYILIANIVSLNIVESKPTIFLSQWQKFGAEKTSSWYLYTKFHELQKILKHPLLRTVNCNLPHKIFKELVSINFSNKITQEFHTLQENWGRNLRKIKSQSVFTWVNYKIKTLKTISE